MAHANPLLTQENDDGDVADGKRIPLTAAETTSLCTPS